MRRCVLALTLGLCFTLPVGLTAAHAQAKKAPAKTTAKKSAPKYDEAKLKALEARLAKNPKDAKLKLEVAEANYQVGFTMMNDPKLPPRVKYPGALKHYRRTLELNPKHQQAATHKKTIEDIYKQLGRPVPQ